MSALPGGCTLASTAAMGQPAGHLTLAGLGMGLSPPQAPPPAASAHALTPTAAPHPSHPHCCDACPHTHHRHHRQPRFQPSSARAHVTWAMRPCGSHADHAAGATSSPCSISRAWNCKTPLTSKFVYSSRPARQSNFHGQRTPVGQDPRLQRGAKAQPTFWAISPSILVCLLCCLLGWVRVNPLHTISPQGLMSQNQGSGGRNK